MKKQNNIETELNKIRAEFYEITKDMSPSEMNAYIKAQVAPVHKESGIRTICMASSDAERQQSVPV